MDWFLVLTQVALFGLFLITVVGSSVTTRPRTPSISVIIDDEPYLRLIFGLFVGALTVSRTGLVYENTIYDIPSGPKDGWFVSWIKSENAAKVAFVFGSAQLIMLSLVGMFSVTLDQTYHYLAAAGTVLFCLICESILLLRRGISGAPSDVLILNLVTVIGIVVCMTVFASYTWIDINAEMEVRGIGIVEWIGFFLVAYVNNFRSVDMRMNEIRMLTTGGTYGLRFRAHHKSHQ